MMKKTFCRWCQSQGAEPDGLHSFCRPYYVDYRKRLEEDERPVLSDDYWLARIGQTFFQWFELLARSE